MDDGPDGSVQPAPGEPLPKHGGGWQRILNESWPPDARSIRDQPKPIAVTARIVWEHDGEERLPGRATRWTRAHVFVEFTDQRWQPVGVWLRPDDVQRR